MSHMEYVQQLEQVNIALESCSSDNKEELLSLKHSLEELISLTRENEEEPKVESIDNEYAQFMAEINEVSQAASNVPKNEVPTDLSQLKQMEGKKCRAPHMNKWGSKGYHNAMICSVVPPTNEKEDAQVIVLFVNPTHEEMLPCPYYFETDCKFADDKCKFSHGEMIPASDLQEFIEPNFASLQIGSPVLAQQSNKLWGRARITKITEKTCTVKFETVKKDMELPFKEILPMDNDECSSSENDDEVEIDEDVVNVSLSNTPSDCRLGDWEKFTKGIGSKLMQKMGYVVGTGLGKNANGRIDPVTAVILPPGKSLDHCMNLREKYGGDKNLFSVERKLKIERKKQELRNKKAYEKRKKNKDVFKFLNETLTNNPSSSSASYNKSKHRQDVRKESCRNLNVESFKTEENIKKTERDINSIKESLTRHKDSTSAMHKNLQHKLNSSLSHLSDLKNQALNIKNEQDIRRDKKKLTIF